MNIKEKLENYIFSKCPKMLTHLDRDPDSLTYGCFDRDYWHYKIRDFCSLILQQAGFTFGYLYKYKKSKGNPYYNNDIIKEWVIASMKFWSKRIESDGGANEYYPYEKGIPPVAFSLYRIAELIEILDIKFNKDTQNIFQAMARAANFLIKHPETEASNQEMVAITAIAKTSKILQNFELEKKALKKWNELVKNNYCEEGWFKEYGGPDIGYLSITLEALIDFYLITRDPGMLRIIQKIINFTSYSVFENGGIAGQYNSRNTEYCLPYGFFRLHKLIPEGVIIGSRLLKNACDYYYEHNSFDDRYLLHYVMPSFVKTLNIIPENINNINLKKDNKEKLFSDAGWFFKKDKEVEIAFGLRKGGIIKILKNNEPLFMDYGYRIIIDKNTVAVTNWDRASEFFIEKNGFTVKSKFMRVKFNLSTPIKHMVLRLLSFCFGRKIIKYLKKRLIFINKKEEIDFERNISCFSDKIIIKDKIKALKNIKKLKTADKYSMRHVASSKSFLKDELFKYNKICLKNIKQALIETTIHIVSEKIDTNISEANERKEA